MSLAFFDFGFSEMLMVGVVALLVFGGNLPDVMRTLGRNYAKLRQTLREFSAPVREEINRVTNMPPPEGVVRQMIDEAADPSTEAGVDVDLDGENHDGATTSAEDEQDEEDLLDEGPLV